LEPPHDQAKSGESHNIGYIIVKLHQSTNGAITDASWFAPVCLSYWAKKEKQAGGGIGAIGDGRAGTPLRIAGAPDKHPTLAVPRK
jgi:hypothetical protein